MLRSVTYHCYSNCLLAINFKVSGNRACCDKEIKHIEHPFSSKFLSGSSEP